MNNSPSKPFSLFRGLRTFKAGKDFPPVSPLKGKSIRNNPISVNALDDHYSSRSEDFEFIEDEDVKEEVKKEEIFESEDDKS
jgi:hypothetical protein